MLLNLVAGGLRTSFRIVGVGESGVSATESRVRLGISRTISDLTGSSTLSQVEMSCG